MSESYETKYLKYKSRYKQVIGLDTQRSGAGSDDNNLFTVQQQQRRVWASSHGWSDDEINRYIPLPSNDDNSDSLHLSDQQIRRIDVAIREGWKPEEIQQYIIDDR
jgi:hypothetical protein